MSIQMFMHKSTASRHLSKMGIVDKAAREALLTQNEAHSWCFDEKAAQQLLAKLSGDLPPPPAEIIDDEIWQKQQRDALAAIKPASAAKVEKQVGKNGKTRPARGVCKAIYDELDKFYADLKTVPTPADAQQLGVANNWHKVTVYRQYADWKRYNGL